MVCEYCAAESKWSNEKWDLANCCKSIQGFPICFLKKQRATKLYSRTTRQRENQSNCLLSPQANSTIKPYNPTQQTVFVHFYLVQKNSKE